MPLFFCIAATVEAVEAREGMARTRRETQIISVCACAHFKELYQPLTEAFYSCITRSGGGRGPAGKEKTPRGLVQGCFSLNSLFLSGTPLFGAPAAAARDLGLEVLQSASTISTLRKQDFVVLV